MTDTYNQLKDELSILYPDVTDIELNEMTDTIQNSPELADDKECNNMTFGDKIKTKCKIEEKKIYCNY